MKCAKMKSKEFIILRFSALAFLSANIAKPRESYLPIRCQVAKLLNSRLSSALTLPTGDFKVDVSTNLWSCLHVAQNLIKIHLP